MSRAPLLEWLLEQDNPSARYLALHHLLGRPDGECAVATAQARIVEMAPAKDILAAQYPAGYWIKPDRGYSPKHRATIWQLVFLTDLGAPRTPAIGHACKHVIDHALRPGDALFSAHKHSTGLYPCLNGDMLRVLWHFDYGHHPATQAVGEALARRVLRQGWVCVHNSVRKAHKETWQPCVWGCIKVLRGFAAIPATHRCPEVEAAIERGVSFMLDRDLAADQQPALIPERSRWLRFGFPLGYGSDLLEALLALAELGIACDQPRALKVVSDKQDLAGRWALERTTARTWAGFGEEGRPNKWVTIRALRVLTG
jgi:hypothetical protein